MDVLIVEPEKSPRMANISGDLESLQKAVGGYIEAVYPYDDPVAIVCNEEVKLIGLPLNRKLEDHDIIAGTFIVCGLGEEDFDSLTPELAGKSTGRNLPNPEIFVKMGSRIVAIPMPEMLRPSLLPSQNTRRRSSKRKNSLPSWSSLPNLKALIQTKVMDRVKNKDKELTR